MLTKRAALAAAVIGIFMLEKLTPRAVRNNNPVNIRISNRNDWQGELPDALNKLQDSEFETFFNAVDGYRAATILLRNYNNFYGYNTISSIITRFAPPTNSEGAFENNTEAYIDSVAQSMDTGAYWPIDLDDDEVMLKLLLAMHKHEAGAVWFGEMFAKAGIEKARAA